MKPERIGRKLVLLLGLAALLVAAVSLIPSVASAEEKATAHDHAAHAAGLQAELAQVRRATARFHRVEEAIAAGYELGWVNGSGVRIITGCVSHPTAGAMGYHYFNRALVADNAVNALEPEALVEPARRPHGAERARDADAHSRPGGGLLAQACLDLEPQPGRDVRGLESGGQLRVAPNFVIGGPASRN